MIKSRRKEGESDLSRSVWLEEPSITSHNRADATFYEVVQTKFFPWFPSQYMSVSATSLWYEDEEVSRRFFILLLHQLMYVVSSKFEFEAEYILLVVHC